ncbi:MAG: Snf7 family protein, partial [Candidatus Methanomethylicia archaeon]|nr:Snf7 family protein [Candidatus Methanomethylicia archaeon]
HDMDHAKIYANELAEIRKMSKMMIQARMALEQIVMRLSTVTELGDIVVTLAPAMGVIKNVKAGISQLLPEAERELGDISTMLSGILVDAGQSGGLSLNFESANEDAQKILGEAAVVAEQRVKEKFPELPAGVSAGEKTGF